MSRLVEIALVGLLGASLVIGAYVAGKRVERTWWRTELAARNTAVKAVIEQVGHEAENLDEQLVALIGGEHAKLATEEGEVAKRNLAPAAQSKPGDPCQPVAAQCLRRGAGGAAAAGGAAGRGS